MSAQTVAEHLRADTSQLSSLSDDELVVELGKRLVLTQRGLDTAAGLMLAQPAGMVAEDSALAGPLDILTNAAHVFLG